MNPKPSHSFPRLHMQEIRRSDSDTRLRLQKAQSVVEGLADALETFIVEERSAISHLKWLKQQVEEFELQCKDLKEHIEIARSSKQKMEKVVEDLRRSLSPMRTLPTELLIKIFGIVIEDSAQLRRIFVSIASTPSSRVMPIILAQVCKRWRSIFCENKSLWWDIHFQARVESDVLTKQRKVDQFRHCAGLGSPSQQSIFIPNCNCEQLRFVCSILGTQTTRFSRIEVEMIEETTPGWPVQRLVSGDVTVYRRYKVGTIEFVLPLLREASTVTIYGTPPDWGSFKWWSLTILTLKNFCDTTGLLLPDNFTHRHLVQLLDVAPNLIELELGFHIDEEDVAPDEPIIMARALRSLSVHLHHFTSGKGLFGVQLTSPALETLKFLSLRCISDISEDTALIFEPLSPKLVVLPMQAKDEIPLAVQLLQRLPNVSCVEMRGHACDALLKFLHAKYHHFVAPSGSLPIPQATTLHISLSDIQGGTLIKFVEIKLQQRMAGTLGVLALEHIAMYTTPGVTVADWGRIQKLLEAGRKANGNQ